MPFLFFGNESMFGMDLRWKVKCFADNQTEVLSYITEQAIIFYFDDDIVNFQRFQDVVKLSYFSAVFELHFLTPETSLEGISLPPPDMDNPKISEAWERMKTIYFG